jgi:hypothetical protein
VNAHAPPGHVLKLRFVDPYWFWGHAYMIDVISRLRLCYVVMVTYGAQT